MSAPAASVETAEDLAGATVGSARRRLAQRLRLAGLDTPELDARILIGDALALDHAGLAAASERVLGREEAAAITERARRRLRHEPVARIVGRKEFWGLPLRLGPDTLVPRPDTETVVEAALAAIGPRRARIRRIADLGTGSGALLLALLHELPHAVGIGTDLSHAALAIARGNARDLGLGARAFFVATDFAAALAGGFDLVVSNPPYVCSGDIAALAPEVRDHDPRRALDGGADGLAAYRRIAQDAPRLLDAEGVLVLELGAGQAPAVRACLASPELVTIAVQPDLAGVDRALVARKTARTY